jgi:hypothetical protein
MNEAGRLEPSPFVSSEVETRSHLDAGQRPSTSLGTNGLSDTPRRSSLFLGTSSTDGRAFPPGRTGRASIAPAA